MYIFLLCFLIILLNYYLLEEEFRINLLSTDKEILQLKQVSVLSVCYFLCIDEELQVSYVYKSHLVMLILNFQW